MATSGNIDVTSTADLLIIEALELLGGKDFSENISTAEAVSYRRTLNYLIKYLAGEGFFIWKRRTATLFLADKTAYQLGGTGDHCTYSFVESSLDLNAASAASTITLESATGFVNGAHIGVITNTGYFFWTTINGSPAGNVVTLTAPLTSAALEGARVVSYSTKIPRPQDLFQCWVQDRSGNDLSFIEIRPRGYYNELTYKNTSVSYPTIVHFQRERTGNSSLYLYGKPQSSAYTLRLDVKGVIENFDSGSDEPDLPQEWFMPLSMRLAAQLGYKLQGISAQKVLALKSESMAMMEQIKSYDRDPSVTIISNACS